MPKAETIKVKNCLRVYVKMISVQAPPDLTDSKVWSQLKPSQHDHSANVKDWDEIILKKMDEIGRWWNNKKKFCDGVSDDQHDYYY